MQDRKAYGGTADDDLAALYEAHALQLRQIVNFSIRAPDALIDDACQVAWSRLIRYRGTFRRDATLAWLVTTAKREALRLVRRSTRELSLDQLRDGEDEPMAVGFEPAAPDEIAELHARLDQVRALPPRQQRLLWLQGLGLSYAEMACYTGASTRTVERQLMRAKRSLHI